MSDICHGLFQRELDMRSAAIGLMTNGTLSVTLVASSLAVSRSLTLAAGAYAVGSLVALVAWDLPRAGRPALCRSGQTVAATRTCVRSLIRRAMPLGLSAALGSAQANFPRYVIAAQLGPAPLAVFTALAYIPTLGNLLVNAAAQASLPVLARDLHASPGRYRARLRRLVIAGTALGIASLTATALLGRPVLAWIYSADYANQISVLLALVAAAAVSYGFVFLGTASTARMRFGSQLLISTAGLAVVACAAGPLVARFGLVGAACSLIAGAVVEGCAYAVLTVRDLRLLDGRGADVPGALPEGVRS
jgi:O-antigen/teichoic acid export membrane protein